MEEGDRKGYYSLRMEPFVTREKLHSDLVKYRQDLHFFSFSGHAGRDVLLLEDGIANADGIALALQQCPQLKLTLLNGCSTKGQVKQLLEMDIPTVIATSAAVDDSKAAYFAIRFFQALTHQTNIEGAYNLALAEAKSRDAQLQAHRKLWKNQKKDSNTPLWGMFCKEANKEVLQFKLSSNIANTSHLADYEPNKTLIVKLWNVLKPYSDSIKEAIQTAKNSGRRQIGLSRRRSAIINSLPQPIAKPIQNLIAPQISGQNTDFHKISLPRLEQTVNCFDNTIELLVYISFAQLWEIKGKYELANTDKISANIAHFLKLSIPKRYAYDFQNLLRQLGFAFNHTEIDLFIPRLKELVTLLEVGHPFQNAYSFLHILKRMINDRQIAENEIATLCVRSEESLIIVLSELAYLSQYTLATIKNIHVQRYLHLKEASFKHRIIELKWITGGLVEKNIQLQDYMYSKSVMLLKKEESNTETYSQLLNLSPFIIDDNAFDPKADLGQVYFFYRYLSDTETYLYRDTVNHNKILELSEPKDSEMDGLGFEDEFDNDFGDDFDDTSETEYDTDYEKSTEAERYDLMKKQFEVFRKEVLGDALP